MRKEINEGPDWFELDKWKKTRPKLKELVVYLHEILESCDWANVMERISDAVDEAATIRQRKLFTKRKFWPWTKKMPCLDVEVDHMLMPGRVFRTERIYPCPAIVVKHFEQKLAALQKELDKLKPPPRSRKQLIDDPPPARRRKII